MSAPRIGITADVDDERYFSRQPYADAVAAAGGLPLLIPPIEERAATYVEALDGVILSGGDDPIMEPFGRPTHPKATKVHPRRQAFELALLNVLRRESAVPTLGICLGMQYMCLHAGGELDQHLPETLPTAEMHWGRREHEIKGAWGAGRVLSHHRQAVVNAGSLRVAATAPDGLIEAVRDERRPFYVGVQWHPERTSDANLGVGLIRELVEAARSRAAGRKP
jgi:putative glutamine amidotransferase